MLKTDLDLFTEQVYCFTPTRRCQDVFRQAPHRLTLLTVIHSAVGNKMVGARVNGKLVPIDYKHPER